MAKSMNFWRASILGSALAMTACSGGGGSDGGTAPPVGGPPPPPPPPPIGDVAIFETEVSTARFLSQATFGASTQDVNAVMGTSASDWIEAQFAAPPSYNLQYVEAFLARPESRDSEGGNTYEANQAPTFAFWVNAVEGEDQLRQRMAFALSQILVISHTEANNLFPHPLAVADYQDILVENAFGNYRDLLDDVTYSPAMAQYLTYMSNLKGDPDSGRMPDENYAREIMQLFTIGLVELNDDGTVETDVSGNTIQTYDNTDVQGLARVFTGLAANADCFFCGLYDTTAAEETGPLTVFPQWHSELQKDFLGTTVAANTDAATSIDAALDALFQHDNLPPFLARQLIQRFVTSDPDPAYVARVADAFETGRYTLPNEETFGTGLRGDLQTTIAAVLFDDEATSDTNMSDPQFGKVREPVLRFIHWARAFNAGTVTPEHTFGLWNTSDGLSQAPYKSPSVFNFYRPGYVAPGTQTGAAGMTVPELQLVNAGSVSSYANFMGYFTLGLAAQFSDGDEASSFIPDYTVERSLAEDPSALVDHLDELLAYGQLSDQTKQLITETLEAVPASRQFDDNYDGMGLRAGIAVWMVMTSPEYLVQR